MDDRLSEELATPDPAIRDFLKIPQDDAGAGAHEGGSPTALDGRGVTNWKPLRDRLRLRRAANAWLGKPAPKAGGAPAAATATTNSSLNHRSNKYNYSPGEAAAAFSRTPSLRTTTPTFCRVGSTRVGPNNSSRSSSRRRASAYEPRYEDHDDADEDNHDDNDDSEGEKDDDEEEERKEEAPAAQMSLMALLEQTDSWDEDDEDDEEGGGEARKNGGGDDDDDDGEGREEEMVHVCCVCMVRHKGAAFAPCGHTFCRLCSRELWVSRGNCPLCNGFIQEILDIF